MRVRILEGIAGADRMFAPGEEVEMDDAVAKRYIADRTVEAIEEVVVERIEEAPKKRKRRS